MNESTAVLLIKSVSVEFLKSAVMNSKGWKRNEEMWRAANKKGVFSQRVRVKV